MRILNVSFKNINSLAGEWEIDFTHGDYALNHDIFVICGPTGSGKTSILDAITLALYGRTPRQEKVNNGEAGNEIMTRETASCFARVTYRCKKGEFVSEWSQRRARGSASGTLQAAEFSIMRDGETISSGNAKQLAGETKKIIELDYEQFSRSILLAQGEFSKFLTSDERERAAILEKLDGSEKYREIGRLICERERDERTALEALYQRRDDVAANVLSDDEREALVQRQAELAQALAEKSAAAKTVDADIAWHEKCAGLERAHGAAADAQARADAEWTAFAAERARLERAGEAAAVLPAFTEFDVLRGAQSADETDAADARAHCAQSAAVEHAAAKAKDDAAVEHAAVERAVAEHAPLFKKIRALDVAIAETEKRLGEANARKSQSAAECAALEKKCAALDAEIKKITNIMEESSHFLEAHEADARIEPALAGLRVQAEHFAELRAEHAAAERAVADGAAAERAAETRAETERAALSALELYAAAHHADAALPGVLAESRAKAADIEALSQKLGDAERSAAETRADEDSCRERLTAAEKAAAALDAELSALFRDDALFIAGELQKRLVPGAACPVCGSTEHPACGGTAGNTPGGDAALSERTANFAGNVRRLSAGAERARTEAADIRHELSSLAEKSARLAAERTAHQAEIETRLGALGALWRPWDKNAQLSSIDTAISELSALNEQFITTNEKIPAAQKSVFDAESALASARDGAAHAAAEVEKIAAEQATLAEKIAAAISPWATDVDFSQLDAQISALGARADSWRREKERHDAGISERAEKTSERNAVANSLSAARAAEEHDSASAADVQAELDGKRAERRGLFGDGSVDGAEQRLSDAAAEKRRALDAAEHALAAAREAHAKHEAQATELARQIAARAEPLAAAECAFRAALSAHQFADEAAFRAAQIPDEERAALEKMRAELDTRRTQAETSARDAAVALEQCRAERSGVAPLPELLERRESLEADVAALTGALVDARAKIQKNEETAADAQKIRAACTAQEKVHARWAKMKSWIGKNDGSDFSVFVQSITFRTLIAAANHHLFEMTERYQLHAKGFLDFEIFDANFERPRAVSNLSGGEKFLVSLSLALGIAEFASRNVRIDSLFLDEGFGTLDGALLADVVGTLKRLQKTGKMLGIITHVESVIASIEQRIEVRPGAGGRSTLSGSGIVRRG